MTAYQAQVSLTFLNLREGSGNLIRSEGSTRASGETNLQNNINAESAMRSSADTMLSASIAHSGHSQASSPRWDWHEHAFPGGEVARQRPVTQFSPVAMPPSSLEDRIRVGAGRCC
jgi:hypothetical protein